MPIERTQSSPTSSACPALMDLAAYLDGRASVQEADALEMHLFKCSACLEAVRDYQQRCGEGEPRLMLVPPRVIERALSLVPDRAVPQWWVTTRRAAAVAATVAICAIGYQVGGAIAAPDLALSPPEDGANVFFGLLENGDLETADDLLFAREGEVS